MAENNTTLDTNLEANPNGAEQIPQNEGNNTTTEPQVVEKQNEGNKEQTYSKKDLDNTAAKARGTAERETRRRILAELGLKDDEMDKLSAFKEAYQNSLSDEEKKNQIMEDLQADNLKLAQDIEEKEYTITALIELTGKKPEDVDKLVKMAKGLKTEDNSIEDAIREVISMININDNNNQATQTNPNMPKSEPIQQPSTTVQISTEDNPFRAGSINLTKQGELLRTNPALARKLAEEAGVKLPI